MFLTVYVDDILIFGKSGPYIQDFKSKLSKIFRLTDNENCDYYLGMNVHHDEDAIRIHQAAFIQQLLDRYDLNDLATVKTPMDSTHKLETEKNHTASKAFISRYLSMVGSLIYLAVISRPDISYAVGVVSRFSSNPNQQHLAAVTRIYAYLKGSKTRGLHFDRQLKDGWQLKGFVDSDWGGCNDTGRSTTGWVFTLAGSPISWASQRQKTAALSTCEAEYMAATEAAKEAIWLKGLINELRIPEVKILAVPLMIDNNAALKLTRNTEFHARTKHINIRYHFIREHVEEGNLDPVRVPTQENISDILTKALARPAFDAVAQKMGLRDGNRNSGGVCDMEAE